MFVQFETNASSLPLGYRRLDGQLCYGYAGSTELRVGDRITVVRNQGVPDDVARLLTLGTGLSLFLHRQGVPVLHGTTVRWRGTDAMVCGPSGVGKSSVTAALLQQGAVLVADDVGAMDGRCVRPGLARIKLWEDTALHFGYPLSGLKRVHPDFAKVSVPVDRVSDAAPLSAVVVLQRGPAGFRELSGSEALAALLANHRVPDILTPLESGRWMTYLAGLLREVRVGALSLPGPLDELENGVRHLLSWVSPDP